MPSAPTVDAVITTYESAHFVADAVRSALEQTRSPARILVVDDGSTDDTQAVLDGFGDAIEVIRHPENRGLPAARNTGIAHATAPLVAFLDADDVWLPTKFERQLPEFETWEDLGICFSSATRVRPNLSLARQQFEFRLRSGEHVFDELFVEAFPIPPSTAVVARAAFDRCGVFNEAMRKAQDYECWLRIAMRYRVSCIDTPLCLRRIHRGSISSGNKLERVLHFDRQCFERCAEAAEEAGVALPMTVDERTLVGLRRRMFEMLDLGDFAAAKQIAGQLARDGRFDASTRMAYWTRTCQMRIRAIQYARRRRAREAARKRSSTPG